MRKQILSIGVIEREDGGITLENVPYGNQLITMGIRPLTNKDRKFIRQLTEKNDPDRDEKIQALLIDQFGDRSGITSQEVIEDSSYAETYVVIDQALMEYIFQQRFVFVLLERPRVVENSVHTEQQVISEFSNVG